MIPRALDLQSIFDALSRLSSALSSPGASVSDRIYISDRIYTLEHSLHSLPQASRTRPDLELGIITATMYIYRFLRQVPQASAFSLALLRRLHTAVDQYMTAPDASIGSCLSTSCILWSCFIGAACSRPFRRMGGNVEWWIGLLRATCGELHITSKESFEAHLSNVVNMGALGKETSEAIWMEINIKNENTG